jgi:hypothetical protein
MFLYTKPSCNNIALCIVAQINVKTNGFILSTLGVNCQFLKER